MDKLKPCVCVYCERELEPAPTEIGWSKIRYGQGICWDCVKRLYESMLPIMNPARIEVDRGKLLKMIEHLHCGSCPVVDCDLENTYPYEKCPETISAYLQNSPDA